MPYIIIDTSYILYNLLLIPHTPLYINISVVNVIFLLFVYLNTDINFLQLYPCSSVVTRHITEIQNTVDYLLTKQFPSGNFPSSLENKHDRLIHWCHGAPGAVFLMLKAYQVILWNVSSSPRLYICGLLSES
jgi:hypothetical protein